MAATRIAASANEITTVLHEPVLAGVAAIAGLGCLGALGAFIFRLAWGKKGADVLTVVAAAMASAVAAAGMWHFFTRTMHLPVWVQALLFAFMEISVLASALRARANVARDGNAGADGLAVWVLTAASGLMSASEASSWQEGLVRIGAPLVAAWLWERSLVPERRAQRERARAANQSADRAFDRIKRAFRERFLARLGVVAPNQSALEIRQESASKDVVRLTAQIERMGWVLRPLRRRRLARRRAIALIVSGAAQDAAKKKEIVAQLATVRHSNLEDLELANPWDQVAADVNEAEDFEHEQPPTEGDGGPRGNRTAVALLAGTSAVAARAPRENRAAAQAEPVLVLAGSNGVPADRVPQAQYANGARHKIGALWFPPLGPIRTESDETASGRGVQSTPVDWVRSTEGPQHPTGPTEAFVRRLPSHPSEAARTESAERTESGVAERTESADPAEPDPERTESGVAERTESADPAEPDPERTESTESDRTESGVAERTEPADPAEPDPERTESTESERTESGVAERTEPADPAEPDPERTESTGAADSDRTESGPAERAESTEADENQSGGTPHADHATARTESGQPGAQVEPDQSSVRRNGPRGRTEEQIDDLVRQARETVGEPPVTTEAVRTGLHIGKKVAVVVKQRLNGESPTDGTESANPGRGGPSPVDAGNERTESESGERTESDGLDRTESDPDAGPDRVQFAAPTTPAVRTGSGPSAAEQRSKQAPFGGRQSGPRFAGVAV